MDRRNQNNNTAVKGDVWNRPLTFKEIMENENLAELMPDSDLLRIGSIVISQFENDQSSRSSWEKLTDDAVNLINSGTNKDGKGKTTPWPGASDVKYPLLLQSIVNSSSRIVPILIKKDQPVKFKVYGKDIDKSKQAKADRCEQYMNWQLLGDPKSTWWKQFDKSISTLFLAGTMFRKVYYDPQTKKKCAEMLPYKDVVVSNDTTCLDEAPAISQIHRYRVNQIVGRIRSKNFIDYEFKAMGGLSSPDHTKAQEEDDYNKLYEFIEQHRYLDLDEDGYAEPYIVIVDKDRGMAVRITRNFDTETAQTTEDGKIIQLDPIKYYQDYHLIPNPDGSYYSLGFAALLYHINCVVNTSINMIMDSASLGAMGGGFIAKNARMRSGIVPVRMNEWLPMDTAPGQKMKDNIIPHPVREPPQILFQMLEFLNAGGKELAGIAEVLSGEMPNRDLPAQTLLTLVDESTKPFSAIHKRIYEDLTKELDILFKLNSIYAEPVEYVSILNDELAIYQQDFDLKNLAVVPGADPSVSSDAQRRLRAEALLAIKDDPNVKDRAVLVEYVSALGISKEEIETFIPPENPNPQPPLEVVQLQNNLKIAEKQLQQKDRELDQKDRELDIKAAQTQIKGHDVASKVVKNETSAAIDLVAAKRENFKTTMGTYHDIVDRSLQAEELRHKKEVISNESRRNEDSSSSVANPPSNKDAND